MAGLSAPGIGSGLDVDGIVTSLMAVEQIPLQRMQVKSGEYLTQISAYGQLRSSMASFQDAVSKLKSFDDINALSVSSADESIFTVSADNDAVIGSYDIRVDRLAVAQKQGSAFVTDNDTTTIGNAGDKMTVTIGADSFSVEIGGKTLSEIQSTINDALDNVGVSAGIVKESDDRFYLVLSSENTGLANAMSLGFTDSLDATIADPLGFTELQGALDAQITIDNTYTLERSSNTLTDAIQGVTINLLNTSTEQTKMNITLDSGAITSAVRGLVDAYNSLSTDLSRQQQGDLAGDSAVRLIERQVRSVLGSEANVSGAYQYMSSVGISFEKDGILTLDSSALKDAVENDRNAVSDLFANDDQGIAFRLDSMLDSMLEDDGLIDAREDGLNASIDDNNDRIEGMQLRLELVEARYRSQFTMLDSLMGQLQTTSDFMTAQLSTLENLLPGSNN